MGRFIYVSLGLLVVAFSLRGSGADCPSGWSSYDQNCYKVFDELKNWDEAERFCMEQGEDGHLVSLGSIEEGNFVAKLTSKKLEKPHPAYVWIGLRAEDQEKLLRTTCFGKHGPVPCGPTITPCFENGEWVPCRSPISRKCLVLSKRTEYLKLDSHNCGFTFPFVCKFLAEPDDSE